MKIKVPFLVCMLLLSACGGDDDESTDSTGEASPEDTATAAPPGDTSILTRFFLESFDAFETAARRLIEQDGRYLVQERAWYFDDNGNGQFDAASEIRHDTYPLQSAGVHYAHAAGLTGAGQVIAVTDAGFLSNHEAFAGKSIDLAGALPTDDHGTQVASVAAGSSANMIGVAPGADLAFGSYATFETLAKAARAAERLGAVALNNSWGFVDTRVGQDNFDRVFSSTASRVYLGDLQSYASQGVVIFSMDNDSSNSQADLMPALPLFVPALETGWLAAINADADLDGDDVIAATRLSAGCLEAAAWCLAAEGTWVGATSGSPTSYGFATGSSFAAPMIAGALALLGEAFPDLTPHQIRIRLLASADNTFAGFEADGEVELVEGFSHAISSEWGHGFLDVKAALLPIGLTTSTMADGSLHDMSEPLVIEGTATGDAVTRALQGVALIADDALGTRFDLPAESLVARRSPRPLSDDLLSRWHNGTVDACCGMSSYFGGTQLVTTGSDATLVSLMLPGERGGAASFGAAVERTFETGPAAVALSVGLGHDDGILLPQWNSDSGSALLAGAVDFTAPLAAGMEVRFAAGLSASLDGEASGALLNSATASFIAPDLFRRGDTLTFSVGLPVAVARGSTSVALPVAAHGSGAAHQVIEVDLAPGDREVRFGLDYRFDVSDRSEVVLSATHAENHGHVGNARSHAVFVGFSTQF